MKILARTARGRPIRCIPVPVPLWKAILVMLKTARPAKTARDRRVIDKGLATIARLRADYAPRRRQRAPAK